ncbi:MAG: metallophosphoesterase family protein [Anaerolineaceae bacterium]
MPSDHLIAVLSDTHVGDRVKYPDPILLQDIQSHQPETILHAGDLCTPAVFEQLAAIAPVHAVQGNRDWFQRYALPKTIHTEINGVRITLTHGHINMANYAFNYLRLFTTGRKMTRKLFQERLAGLYPDANLIIYGHTHYQVDEIVNGQRFLNPGAGYPHRLNNYQLQYCLLTITASGEVRVQKISIPAPPKL